MTRFVSSLLLLSLACGVQANSAAPDAQVWRYQVFLDEREIGSHQVQIRPGADGLRVSTRADYAVRVLAIPFYRYSHWADEHWQAGCLREIRAETDANGEPSHIAGRSDGGRLLLETPDGSRGLDGCVRSFAYWKPELLAASQRLLNTQTGEYLAVQWQLLGQRPLPLGEGQATAYRLANEQLQIDLWYDDQGRCLALESPLPEGGILRYRLQEAG